MKPLTGPGFPLRYVVSIRVRLRPDPGEPSPESGRSGSETRCSGLADPPHRRGAPAAVQYLQFRCVEAHEQGQRAAWCWQPLAGLAARMFPAESLGSPSSPGVSVPSSEARRFVGSGRSVDARWSAATFSHSALNYAVEPLVTLAPTRHPHNTSRLRHQPGCSTDSAALESATPGGRTQSHADVAATAGTPQDHRLVGVCCCKNRRMRGVLKCLIVTSHPAGAARSAARTRALQPQAGS
jgi:hypothetical protein